MSRKRPLSAFGQACIALILLALGSAGCASRGSAPSIVPDSVKGRDVLDSALMAWKQGTPVGMLDRKSPAVQVIDSFRKPGQSLDGYEILAETATPRARTFSLRLNLKNPDERPLVRYLLVGIDPVLVFRQEDYDMLSHFEHSMDPVPRPAGEPPPSTQKSTVP